jgi:hypothetical protein
MAKEYVEITIRLPLEGVLSSGVGRMLEYVQLQDGGVVVDSDSTVYRPIGTWKVMEPGHE